MISWLFTKTIILSPLAFGIVIFLAAIVGWALYGLRGYRHWVKRFNRYSYLPPRPKLYRGYGYVEYIPSVTRNKTLALAPQPDFSHTKPSAKDDLKIIEGIGPKIETILNRNGIHTWHELSRTPLENLKRMLDHAGSRYHAHDPSSWSYQAHLAHSGAFEDLKKFQDLDLKK